MKKKSKKSKSKITFIIGTFNEEKRVAYPIKSFLPYGDVLVVDNYSTDRTVAIAESLGARVIKYKNQGWAETEKQVRFVFSHVNTDWVCIASADELIPKACLELYKKVSEESKYKIVVQRKKTLLYEAGTDFIVAYINIHFFKKGALDYTSKSVHERKFASHVRPSEVLYLPPIDEYSIYHFSVYNTEKVFNTQNIYSSIQAKFISRRFLLLKLILVPFLSFFQHYVIGGLYSLGVRGFISSVQLSFYYFLTYSKAYELHNNITLDTIEKSFIKEKIKLLHTSPKSSLIKKITGNMAVVLISFLHKKYKFKKSSSGY